jgi:glycosyltransferase involved in cell wall biosynthesis
MMISIITPVFNGERFIESCIVNVIEQNCPSLEHIIIDGASMDSTVSIVKKYADQHPHIRWVSEKDRGQSDAMNKGIVLAQGDIIGVLNADDYYEPDVLRKIVKTFNTLPVPSLLVGNCNVWDDKGNLLFVSKPDKINLTNILLGRFMEAFPMNPAGYFYHASLHGAIGLYKTDEHYGMDLDFVLRAVQQANVVYRDEVWGNSRYLPGTKTHNDVVNGNNSRRVMAIVNGHLMTLPRPQRYRIYFYRFMAKRYGQIKAVFRKVFGRTAP